MQDFIPFGSTASAARKGCDGPPLILLTDSFEDCIVICFRHSSQNVWRHGSNLGVLNNPRQIEHVNSLLRPLASPLLQSCTTRPASVPVTGFADVQVMEPEDDGVDAGVAIVNCRSTVGRPTVAGDIAATEADPVAHGGTSLFGGKSAGSARAGVT